MKDFYDAIRPMFGRSLSQGQVDGIAAILDATHSTEITHRAYMLATAKHETGDTMKPIYERGNIAYFNKYEPGTRIGKTLGNTVKGDGYLFRGRGLVQITGRSNYRKFGIEAHPDEALKLKVALHIMISGMSTGAFTGKKMANYLPGDYVNARRVVNGTDKAELIADYARKFEAALRLLDVDPAPLSPNPVDVNETPFGERQGFWATLIMALAGIWRGK